MIHIGDCREVMRKLIAERTRGTLGLELTV